MNLYSAVEDALNFCVACSSQSWLLQEYILRDSEVYDMDYDFDKALDSATILNFDLNNFTKKDIVHPKGQYVLVSSHFSKSIQEIDVKVDMT